MITRMLRYELRRLVRLAQLWTLGRIPYFGCWLWMPRGSHVAKSIVRETIYEEPVMTAMRDLARTGNLVLDVGANVGATSLPLLVQRDDIEVVSFECSPAALSMLRRTHAACPHRARWRIIDCAVGSANGESEFHVSDFQGGVLDGFRDTGRAAGSRTITVQTRTLDSVWEELGCPPVSVVKIDIEGAETEALAGARRLLAEARPAILLEWHGENLAAYGVDPLAIFELAGSRYCVHALPDLAMVTPRLLRFFMGRTYMFALIPVDQTA